MELNIAENIIGDQFLSFRRKQMTIWCLWYYLSIYCRWMWCLFRCPSPWNFFVFRLFDAQNRSLKNVKQIEASREVGKSSGRLLDQPSMMKPKRAEKSPFLHIKKQTLVQDEERLSTDVSHLYIIDWNVICHFAILMLKVLLKCFCFCARMGIKFPTIVCRKRLDLSKDFYLHNRNEPKQTCFWEQPLRGI